MIKVLYNSERRRKAFITKELKQKHREYIKNILNFDYYFTDDIIY